MKKFFTFGMLLAVLACIPQTMMAKYTPILRFPDGAIYVSITRTADAFAQMDWPGYGTLHWVSEDESVFTVDENGVITGLTINSFEETAATLLVYYDENEYFEAGSASVEVWVTPELSIFGDETNIDVTPDHADDILGDGTLSYDFATRTLTMDNCEMEMSITYYSMDEEPLTLNLVGDNLLSSNSVGANNLIVTGGGSLTIDGSTIYGDTITIDNASLFVEQEFGFSSSVDYVFEFQKMTIQNNGFFHAKISGGLGEYDGVGYVRQELVLGEGIGYLHENVHWVPDVTKEHVYSVYESRPDLFNGGFFLDVMLLRGTLEIGPLQPEELIVLPEHETTEIRFDGSTENAGKVAVTLGENDEIVEGEDGYVALNTPVSLTNEEVTEILNNNTPGDDTFKNKLPGVTVLLPAGEGTFDITYELQGTHMLVIQEAGSDLPMVEAFGTYSEKHLKGVQFLTTEPSLMHIYIREVHFGDGVPAHRAPAENEPVLKLYSLSVSPKEATTSIEAAESAAGSAASQKVLLNGKLYIMNNGTMYNVQGKRL